MSRRSEYDDWRGDVIYDAWRAGLNTDAISEDRMLNAYDNGNRPDDFVFTLQREAQERREQREFEQQMRDDADYDRYLEYLEHQENQE